MPEPVEAILAGLCVWGGIYGALNAIREIQLKVLQELIKAWQL